MTSTLFVFNLFVVLSEPLGPLKHLTTSSLRCAFSTRLSTYGNLEAVTFRSFTRHLKFALCSIFKLTTSPANIAFMSKPAHLKTNSRTLLVNNTPGPERFPRRFHSAPAWRFRCVPRALEARSFSRCLERPARPGVCENGNAWSVFPGVFTAPLLGV